MLIGWSKMHMRNLQRPGEPLDGCLNIEEFAEVMRALAEYRGNEKEAPVKAPVEQITYVNYEIHESLGFDYAVVIPSQQRSRDCFLN